MRHSMLFLAAILVAIPAVSRGGTISGAITAEDGLAPGTTVYVEGNSVGKAAAPVKRQRITQKNSAFVPSAVVTTVGVPVDFPNEDKIYHNVFSLTDGNDFDLGLYRGGVSKPMVFKKTGEVDVYCNIHPDMVAKVLVIDTPYVAEVGADGKYAITGVPAGSWVVTVWSPEHDPVSKTVVVGDGDADVKSDASLKRRKSSKTHLNKNGEQYGRYK